MTLYINKKFIPRIGQRKTYIILRVGFLKVQVNEECEGGTQYKGNARTKRNHLQGCFPKKHPFLKETFCMQAYTQICYLPTQSGLLTMTCSREIFKFGGFFFFGQITWLSAILCHPKYLRDIGVVSACHTTPQGCIFGKWCEDRHSKMNKINP